MASDETRFALIEKELIRLAEDIGMIKDNQSETRKWISDHKIEHLNSHNEVMTMMTAISVDVGIIKKERTKEETNADIKSKKRNELFDRLLRIALAIVVLAGAFGAFIDFVRR